MADAQQPFGGPLANPFQILRQRDGFRFGGDQAAILFPEGLLAFLTPPALVAVAGGSVLDGLGGGAMGAVHGKCYSRPSRFG